MYKRILSRSVLPAFILGAGLSSPALAQTDLYTILGDNNNDRLGGSVAAAGDVNNDGLPDLIVGASEDNAVLFAEEGYARVYTGGAGSGIFLMNGAGTGDGYGTSVAGAGDTNGDGFDDFIVGSPFSGTGGTIHVYSGATGLQRFSFTSNFASAEMGHSVASAGDVNNDGFDDVIVGAWRSSINGNSSGQALVFSGINGAILHSFSGGVGDRVGTAVAGVGDVNNDGHDDIAVGSLAAGARVYSGATGATIHNFFTLLTTDAYGVSVAGIGDITGDGISEIAIGATVDADFFFPGAGFVEIRNGASGLLLYTFNGDLIGDSFGFSVAGAGDFDGDGTPDILVGAIQASNGFEGYARVFSGANGAVITTFSGGANFDRFGYSVAGLGDVDGNGTQEIAIGAPTADPNANQASGLVRVISGTGNTGNPCNPPVNYCTPMPNSAGTARIAMLGSQSVSSNDMALITRPVPAFHTGLFIYSPDQAQLPVGNGNLCIGGTTLGFLLRLPGTVSDANGNMFFRMDHTRPPHPAGQIVPGSTWNFQAWFRDSTAGPSFNNFSDGLEITFCP